MSDQAVNAPETNDTEPHQYVGYTRPNAFRGSPERLEALAHAYIGFQWGFICNALMFLVLWSIVGTIGSEVGDFNLSLLIGVIIVSIATTLMSIRPCRRYADGLGRAPASGIGTAIVLGLQSCFCFGLVGYSSVIRTTVTEIKKYGIKPRFWGIYTADVPVRAAEMRANPNPPPPAVPTPATNLSS